MGHQRARLLSRHEIESLLAAGRKIVIVDQAVLRLDTWLSYHPGGEKSILHMLGRDATDEVRAFHSTETQAFMERFQIGRIQGQWIDFVPCIQGGTVRQCDLPRTGHNSLLKNDQDSRQSPPRVAQPAISPLISGTSARKITDNANRDSHNTATPANTPSPNISGDSTTRPVERDASADMTQRNLEHDLELYPELDPATQASITTKYRQLEQRIRDEHLYDCDYGSYVVEATRYVLLALTSYVCLRTAHYAFSGIFLGMLWHQLVFTVHDAGHMGITHDFHIDSLIGIFIANFLGGLSCCWWKQNHNTHHIVTNSVEHDPDIQHMPFFAVSHRFFQNLRSTYYDRIMTYDLLAKFFLRYQHYLYYPILTFGRFFLYVLGWQYIFCFQGPRKGPAWWHRYLEMIGQAFFWYWYGYLVVYRSIPNGWDRFVFVMLSHTVTMPVHVQNTLSHFAMSTSDFGVVESFPQRMLRTTMDIDCPPWLDFFHGKSR